MAAEDLTAEAWFANLNWPMQRRVLEVIDSGEDMAHVLLYFPLPFRGGAPGSTRSRGRSLTAGGHLHTWPRSALTLPQGRA